MELYVPDDRGRCGEGCIIILPFKNIVFQIEYVNEVLDEFRKERIADEHVLQLKKAVKLLGEFYFHTMNVSSIGIH